MILGADHVALTATNLNAAIRSLGRLGFREQFRVIGLPNDPSKRHLVHTWCDVHDIALCRSGRGRMAIELIRHSDVAFRDGGGAIVLSGRRPGPTISDPRAAWEAAIAEAWSSTDLTMGARAVRVMDLPGTAFWLDQPLGTGTGSHVAGVVIPVVSMEGALEFWQGGLKLSPSGQCRDAIHPRWTRLEVQSPSPGWRLSVLLIEDPAACPRVRMLDAEGMTAVCFVCTDIDRTRERLLAYDGVAIGPVFGSIVNAQRLRICIGHGPEGELIELLQVDSGSAAHTMSCR